MYVKGQIRYMEENFKLIGSPVPNQKQVYFDIGENLPSRFEDKPWLLFDLINLHPENSRTDARDLVIQGKPGKIELGEYSRIGERTVLRADEVKKGIFRTDANVGDGCTFHSVNNELGRCHTKNYVTFHGCKVGDDAKIGKRSILDVAAVVPSGVKVGDCCYVPFEIKENVPSGTIYLSKDLVVTLPEEAIRLQMKKYHDAFVEIKSLQPKEHRLNLDDIGYFDPLSFIKKNTLTIGEGIKTTYVGPFALVDNCGFLGSNVNVQDHNIRIGTNFFGNNIGAHGVYTQNVDLHPGASTLFHALLENVILEEGAVAGPLATIVGSLTDKLVIPKGQFVTGYVTPANYDELIKNKIVKENEKIIAFMAPVKEIKGLEDRLVHIQELHYEDNGHYYKGSNIVAVPQEVIFNPVKREQAESMKSLMSSD